MHKYKSPMSIIGILMFYVLLTSLISCSGDSNGSSTYLTFENLHQVDQDLREALESQKIKVVESDGNPETTEHALIINGDSLAADNLKTDEHVISYLKKEKGLLIVNATSAHREALAKIFGFFSGHDGIRNYYVHIMPGTDGRHLRIIHFPEVVKPDFSKMSIDDKNDLRIDIDAANNNFEKFKSDFETSVASRLFAQDVRKYIDNDFKASQAILPTESIPGNLKHYIFYTTAKKSWRLDNFWWETWNRVFFYTVTAIYPAIPPMEGYQTGGYEYETKYTVYLNNDPNDSKSPYQWLAIDHMARLDPSAGPNSKHVSGKTIAMPMMGGYYETYPQGGSYTNVMQAKGFGWGQMKYVYSTQPLGDGELQKLRFYQCNPANPNSSTQYTSGHDIQIGFNAGLGPSGGISGTWTSSNSTTVNIPDWTVLNNSHPDAKLASWTWYSENPSYLPDKSMDGMNSINLNYYEVPSSAVFRSDSLINGQIKFEETYGVDTVKLGCYTDKYSMWFINYKWFAYQQLPTFKNDVIIDFGKVLYPIAWKLSVSPPSIKGGSNTTGTITIDQPAPQGGTTVVLSSNNTDWVSVPATVIISEGKSAEIFNITTYPVSGNATATIFAVVNGSSVSGEVTVLK